MLVLWSYFLYILMSVDFEIVSIIIRWLKLGVFKLAQVFFRGNINPISNQDTPIRVCN